MYENYRVLFVDDEINILNTLRRGLMDEDYYCLFANSAKEALEFFEGNKIDVIVSDIRMPEMNGLDLLKIVAEKSPSTVKIVLSGYTQLPQVLATINQVDIFKFITKPWSLEDLIMVVRKALDYYIIQEENANYKKALEAKNQAYQNIIKRINEIVENAKKSSEMLGLCGKAILGFGKNFSMQDRLRYQSVFLMQDKIFEILSNAVTNEKREFDSRQIADMVADLFSQTTPHATIERNNHAQSRVYVNEKMLGAALAALMIVFGEEFNRGGCFVNLGFNEFFKIAIVSPNAELGLDSDESGEFSVLDIKIDFIRSILTEVLAMCQIDMRISKVNDTLAIEFTITE